MTTAPYEQTLRIAWQRLLPSEPDLGESLLRRWAEPHRHYHDQRHLTEMLHALDLLDATAPTELLAAWFHDAVYDGVPGDDERASAELARATLTDTGLLPEQVEEVVRLVLLTITHLPAPGDVSGARVMDADLAILGSSPERYAESVRDIRDEYARYDDDAWRSGRLQVLETFLATDPLFHSARGQALWQARALANVAAEAAALRG